MTTPQPAPEETTPLREVQRFHPGRARLAIAKVRKAGKRGGIEYCVPPRCEFGDGACMEFASAMFVGADGHGVCLCSLHEPTPQPQQQ
jgi:hypothetical protein